MRTVLIVLRGLTGLFSAGLMVLPSAIIRDRFDGDRMARLQSLVSMMFMIVPVIAPALGQGVLLFAGWRWIFGIMATMSALLLVWSFFRLEESLAPENRQPIRLAAVAGVGSTNAHVAPLLVLSARPQLVPTAVVVPRMEMP